MINTESWKRFSEERDYSKNDISEIIRLCNEYNEECKRISEQCEAEGYPETGNNYELRCSELWKYYEEQLNVIDEKYQVKVEFNGGEGRQTCEPVNYMLANVDDVELYAEIEIPDDEDPDEYGYDELKEDILSQARENNIPEWKLKFWWD